MRLAWGVVFCIPPNDTAGIYSGLSALQDTVEELRAEVYAVPNMNYNRYLTGTEGLKLLLSPR